MPSVYASAYCRQCVLSHFSSVRLCETLWSVARQASLSMGFSRQEYWSGLPCHLARDLPNPGIKHASLKSILVYVYQSAYTLCLLI